MNAPRTLPFAVAAVLLSTAGCSESYGSVDDLVEATGCVDLHEDNPDGLGETIRCQREQDRADLYLRYFDDEDDREESLSLQRLTTQQSGGAAKVYVAYEDHWVVTCFDESVCREVSEDPGRLLRATQLGSVTVNL